MNRLQLAIDVEDLDRAVEFYSHLFDTRPAKVKPGYVNFSICDPPLKLVLFQNAKRAGSINHLGIEVETTKEVVAAERRIAESGLDTIGVQETECCYAKKTETWIDGPDGIRWEWYVKHSESERFENMVIKPRERR